MTNATTAQTAVSVKPPRPRPVSLAPASRRVQIGVAVALGGGLLLAALSRPHFELLFAAPLVIQLHVLAAISALLLGAALLVLRKGRTFHRVAGWTWVALMTTVAFASLFITTLHPGHWSWIHILSGWTLFSLPLGVYLIKRKNIAQHRRMMMSSYIGGLIIAGGFTFLPGRLMYEIFFR